YLGRNPTPDDIKDLLAGRTVVALDANGAPVVDFIGGTASLEQQRIDMQSTLQDADFGQETSERIARQDFEKKLLTGFSGVGADGEPTWIRGTQSDAEYILTLQSELGIDAEEARWRLDEDRRRGYDKLILTGATRVNFQGEEVPIYQSVHVAGTEDFTTDTITKQFQQDIFKEYGGYRVRRNEDGTPALDENGETVVVWEGGTQEHQDDLEGLRDTLVRDGWSADMAMSQAQYIQGFSTANMDYMGQTFRNERAWYYQNVEGMDAAEAKTAAEADWTANVGTFTEPLQLTLQNLALEADKERFDAQQRADMLNTSIAGIAGMAPSVWSMLFGDSTTGGLPGAVGATVGGWGGLTNLLLGSGEGKISQAALMTQFPGLTAAQANAMMPSLLAAAGTGGVDPSDLDAAGRVVSTAGLVPRFGNWISKGLGGAGVGVGALGTVTGAVAIGAIAYGAYKGYKHLKNKYGWFGGGDGFKSDSPEVKEIEDAYKDGLSYLDAEKLEGQIHADGGWQEEEGWDQREWHSKVNGWTEENASDPAALMGQMSGAMRRLFAGDVFNKDPGQITASEDRMLKEVWKLMPGSARSSDDLET
ncbi:hypothetical protein LCGC14_2275090, partial [marine sediment metagenome]